MTPRTGQHRRTTSAVAPVLGELHKTRDTLARVEAERDALRALVVDMAGGEGHEHCRAAADQAVDAAEASGVERGRRQEAAERDRAWHAAADPIARGGPSHAALEILRWGPPVENCPRHGDDCTGRLHFGDPRPGDYTGGPVDWPEPARADVPAVA